MKVRRDRNGCHVFDRETGLNILLDEISVPPPQWDPAPRFVAVALTNACDLHCSFCYAPKSPARLEQETVLRWASELDSGGCLGIGFGGGEPSLHPAFAAICRRVAEETRLGVSFTTHGHRLTDVLADQLLGVVHFVRVSMDGIDGTYSRIRGRDFSEFLTKLTLVRRIAPFGINYVVNKTTINELDLAAKLAFDHGARELLLLPERPVAGQGGIDESTRQLLADWIHQNDQFRLAISKDGVVDGLPIASPFDDPDGLTAYAHIDASGWLRRSSFSPHGVRVDHSLGAALDQLRAMTEAEQ